MKAKFTTLLALIAAPWLAFGLSAADAAPHRRYALSQLRQSQFSQINQSETVSNQAARNTAVRTNSPGYPDRYGQDRYAQDRYAQVFRTDYTVPAGQPLVTKLADDQTLYINNGETVSVRLRVDRDVRATNSGVVLIPAGAIVEGQFVPVDGGSRFVASTLSSRGASVSLSGGSDLITDVKDPRQVNTGSIATDAAIGAAGAAVLAGVLGDRAIATEEVLAGAAAGVIVGNVTAPRVTVIEADDSIVVTTDRDINFSQRDDF
jgi:hypothetical protein